jgi:CheY-like chemotaxis protein/HPt (histidine-containing phosphotransfer) domain-containing protein
LVVDDNATSRDILLQILESFSFEVTLAASGEEGLAELEGAPKEQPFELVIMDWKMPGIDGIEASKCIKKHSGLSKIPAIVLVTAYGREDVMQRAEQAGLEGFLIKPVNPSVMFDTIMQALGEEMPKLPRLDKEKEEIAETLRNIRGLRILLVEDNEINRQVAKEILEGADLKVSLAYDGREAVNSVKENEYDAVLMDVQMPLMDGYEATRAIRSDLRFKDLPIIAMTAHAMAGDREKSLEAGMNDHVSKPIDPEALYRTLEKWVRRPAAEGEEREKVEIGGTLEAVMGADVADLTELDGINVEAGLKRLLGNRVTYRRILFQFVKEFRNAVDTIKALVVEEKYHEARLLAHSIKGASGNIGAERLQMSSAAVEKWFTEGGRGLPEREYEEFSKELNRVMDSLSILGAEEGPSAVTKDETPTLAPHTAKDIADRLRNAVGFGDVAELGKIASELTSRNDASSNYGEEINRLAAAFDFDGIMELANTLDKGAAL